MSSLPITYFSDVLCVWAYVAELRVAEVSAVFGDQVRWRPRLCSVFGDTPGKIAKAWGDKGGYGAFNAHLNHVAGQFPEVTIRPDLWLEVRPASSTPPHVYIKAAELAEAIGACAPGAPAALTHDLRHGFFRDGRDIARRDVQRDIAAAAGLDVAAVEAFIDDGRAFASLAHDYQEADRMRIQGSPSFVLNDGRQILYGNVGFKIIEANIREILRRPTADQASWC
jgi:predicted DsbA family dithiol-disulfide isomerase